MEDNDNAGYLNARVVWTSIASMLAPTCFFGGRSMRQQQCHKLIETAIGNPAQQAE
jgi:hypothetical protein